MANIAEALAPIKRATTETKLDLQMSRLAATVLKYRPDQARVPAGVSEGGQWTRDGSNRHLVAMPKKFRLTPQLELECEEQLARDTLICTSAGSADCHGQAALRYGACRNGKYIPPLNFGGLFDVDG